MPTTKPSARLGNGGDGNGTPAPDKQSGFLRLPLELQVSIFQELPELRSAIALRLACRHLNSIYLANEGRIKSSLVQRLVSPFHDHYKFLTRLWLPKSSILYPPPSGWPSITPEIYRHFSKTSFAIEVLRHLPYVEHTCGRNTAYPEGYVINYSQINPESCNAEGDASNTYQECGPEELQHTVNITRPQHSGIQIMLNTFSGTICEKRIANNRILRKLRVTHPIEDYFAAKKRAYERLDSVFLPIVGILKVPNNDSNDETYDDAEIEANGKPIYKDSVAKLRWIRHLFRKFGWPRHDWLQGEARMAIEQFCHEYESFSE